MASYMLTRRLTGNALLAYRHTGLHAYKKADRKCLIGLQAYCLTRKCLTGFDAMIVNFAAILNGKMAAKKRTVDPSIVQILLNNTKLVHNAK